MKTIEVQVIEPDRSLIARKRRVMGMQPGDKAQHVGIAPHPQGKAGKVAQGVESRHVAALSRDIAMDPMGVRPIRLHGHGGEPFFANQALGQHRPVSIKFVRAVRGLADQRNPR